ncbi:hypothetical protein [Paraflavitalea speifideaquila]|uniref:hypothetical protein n=1 Tax=Paraflavitalea speifideaquila TaxID=3076558 RepID=UPI0028E84DCB|nr:hypothetical protein [Paraflavitalea speifideiaquila]
MPRILEYIYLFTLGIATLSGIVSLFHKPAVHWKVLAISGLPYAVIEGYSSWLSWHHQFNLYIYNPVFVGLHIINAIVMRSILHNRIIKRSSCST